MRFNEMSVQELQTNTLLQKLRLVAIGLSPRELYFNKRQRLRKYL